MHQHKYSPLFTSYLSGQFIPPMSGSILNRVPYAKLCLPTLTYISGPPADLVLYIFDLNGCHMSHGTPNRRLSAVVTCHRPPRRCVTRHFGRHKRSQNFRACGAGVKLVGRWSLSHVTGLAVAVADTYVRCHMSHPPPFRSKMYSILCIFYEFL